MNNNNINELLNKAAAFENKSALWSEEELLDLLKNAPVSSPSPPPSRVQPRTFSWRKLMIGSTLLAGAAAAYVWLAPLGSPQMESFPTSSKGTQTEAVPQASSLASNGSDHSAEAALSSEGSSVSAAQEKLALSEHHTTLRSDAQQTDNDRVSTSAPTIPQRIAGIRALKLSTEELAALGVQQKNNSYEVLSELGYNSSNRSPLNAFVGNQKLQDKDQRTQITLHQENLGAALKPLGYDATADASVIKFRVRMEALDIRSVPAPASEASRSAVYPLIITHESVDENGSEASKALLFGNVNRSEGMNPHYSHEVASLFALYTPTAEQEATMKGFPLLSKLIPVELHIEDKQNGNATILLWYYPSEEFIRALPPRYAEQVRKEINGIEKFEQKYEQKHKEDSTHSLLEQRFSGEYNYTDVARARNGAMEILSIGPNPASEHVTLRFKLYEERNVSVVLYDMSGAKVALLSTPGSLMQGENSVELQVGNLASGAYLLSIVSERSEQAIQRLIIQH